MARKKESETMPATKSTARAVRLDLSPELHNELRVEAARQDKSMAFLVRELIEVYLKTRPKRRG
jgi:predicted HicB family RNase H-like nuclease